jgi:hypothetical protein
MAILIDPPAWPAHGTLWSHLVSDSGYDELHAFAKRLSVPRRGFDLDHYDVPASLHDRAIALGALPVTARDVVFALRNAGLRVRQAEREAVTPLRRRQFLSAEWANLGDLVGAGAARSAQHDWLALGETLIARWNEAHRSYHDERHLEDVLLALDQLATRGERVSADTLLAAWFHDAVYTGTGDDELASAELATSTLAQLPLDAALVSRVGEFIVAPLPAVLGVGAARVRPRARSGLRVWPIPHPQHLPGAARDLPHRHRAAALGAARPQQRGARDRAAAGRRRGRGAARPDGTDSVVGFTPRCATPRRRAAGRGTRRSDRPPRAARRRSPARPRARRR